MAQEEEKNKVPSSEKWRTKMRERNPERKYDEDPEEFYGELDTYDTEREGELSKLRDSDSKMRQHLMDDPRLSSVISMRAEGKDPLMAIYENYGDDIMALKDDPSMAEEIAKKQQEKMESATNKKKLEEEQTANLEQSGKIFNEFLEKNGLSEEQGRGFFDKVAEIVDNVFMGRWTPEMCEQLYKGLNYDNDIQAASEIGAVEERNKKIREKNVQVEGDGIPVAANGSAAKGNPQKANSYRRDGFFKQFENKKV